MRSVDTLKSVGNVVIRTPGLKLGYKAAGFGERVSLEQNRSRGLSYSLQANQNDITGWVTGTIAQFLSPRFGLDLEKAIDDRVPASEFWNVLRRSKKDFVKDFVASAALVTVIGVTAIALAVQPELVIPTLVAGKLLFNAAENAYLEVKGNRTRR